MIRQETDAGLINRVSNADGVRQNICYRDGTMNWSIAIGDPDIAILSNGHDAVAVFAQTAPRIWQAHTMFAPTCRGRAAIDAAKAMIEHMRPRADVIWGATPLKNCAARWFNRQLGAMPIRRDIYEAEGEVEIFEIRM